MAEDFSTEACGLERVERFTSTVTGWQSLPEGGQVPVRTPITPYFRWYCGCGLVGGRTSTEAASISAHAAHVERQAAA